MAHFAKLNENNIVTQVIVVANAELLDNGVENENKGVAFCKALFGGEWVQTSYTGRIRKQFAGVDCRYDVDADVFVAPRPFPSWTLDANHDWQPPTPMPEGPHFWNEEILTWVPLQNS